MPETTRRPSFAAAAALCSALTAASLAPSAHGQETAAGFFDSVDVEIVNVEVFVTDRRGNPISGLRAEDFEIFHDKKPVEITNFFAASANTATEEIVATVAEPERAQPATVLPKVDQQLNLVVFIDNQNLSPRNRNRVIDALRGSLFFNLQPEDRVTLVAYDGSLQIRQGFAGDPRDLAEALDEIASGGATGVFSGFDRAAILRELQQTDLEADIATGGVGFGGGAGTDWQDILQTIRTYTQEEFARTVATVNTMGRFVDTLSGLQGRKALIYVSDGLSLRPGEALYQAFSRKAPPGFTNADIEGREFDATQIFEELGKRANASRVTFYTMLAAGGKPQTITPAERSAFFNAGSDAATLGQVWSEGLETLERSNFRGSMEILAESTGGLATLSTRNFGGALRRIKQDLGTYYSLGYEAPEQDGEDHRIEVKIKVDGLRVRHRETFRLRSTEEQMAVRTRSALLFSQASNPFGVQVDIGPPQKDEKGLYLVPLIVKFPLDQIVLAPIDGSHRGEVSIYVGAREVDGGGLSPVQRTPAPVNIPDDKLEQAMAQLAGYRLMLHLKPGEHAVAVSVRDDVSKTESTALLTIDAESIAAALAEAANGAGNAAVTGETSASAG